MTTCLVCSFRVMLDIFAKVVCSFMARNLTRVVSADDHLELVASHLSVMPSGASRAHKHRQKPSLGWISDLSTAQVKCRVSLARGHALLAGLITACQAALVIVAVCDA